MRYRELEKAVETYYGVKLHELKLEHENQYYVKALKQRDADSIAEFLRKWRIRRKVDTKKLKQLINKHQREIQQLLHENLLYAKLYKHRDAITLLYGNFSRQLGYTGASKALHILAPTMLVMWDNAIRKTHGLTTTPEAYYNFHLRMQNELQELNEDTTPATEIPVTKLLDVYNMVKTRE